MPVCNYLCSWYTIPTRRSQNSTRLSVLLICATFEAVINQFVACMNAASTNVSTNPWLASTLKWKIFRQIHAGFFRNLHLSASSLSVSMTRYLRSIKKHLRISLDVIYDVIKLTLIKL